jgi:hypothetical protein
VFVIENELGHNVTAAETLLAEQQCLNNGAVVLWMVAVAFVLHVTLFWYPCFRCSLHFFETLTEKEALEGLLSDTNDEEDNDDIVLKNLTSPSPSGKSGREREFKDSAESVVSPPLSVYPQ